MTECGASRAEMRIARGPFLLGLDTRNRAMVSERSYSDGVDAQPDIGGFSTRLRREKHHWVKRLVVLGQASEELAVALTIITAQNAAWRAGAGVILN